jgi:hypothetical protein
MKRTRTMRLTNFKDMKDPIVALALLVMLAVFMFPCNGLTFVGAGGVIDVFIQKTPSGKGINQSSGGFKPQELVILYANVTYGGSPVEAKLVSFVVRDPDGKIIFGEVNTTDAYGITTVKFRLPTNAPSGIWTADALTDVASVTVHDMLTFQISVLGDLGSGTPVPQFFLFDGACNGYDIPLFLECYKGTAPLEAMYLGDLGSVPLGSTVPQFFTYDGKVDSADIVLFLICYKGQGP